MIISFKNVASLFSISAETVASLREENAALKARSDQAETDLRDLKVHMDWLRSQFNQLQHERALLLDRVYGLHVPTPQLVAPPPPPPTSLEEFSFEDLREAIGWDRPLEVE